LAKFVAKMPKRSSAEAGVVAQVEELRKKLAKFESDAKRTKHNAEAAVKRAKSNAEAAVKRAKSNAEAAVERAKSEARQNEQKSALLHDHLFSIASEELRNALKDYAKNNNEKRDEILSICHQHSDLSEPRCVAALRELAGEATPIQMQRNHGL
jgi:uncharacterized membrane protein YqiK